MMTRSMALWLALLPLAAHAQQNRAPGASSRASVPAVIAPAILSQPALALPSLQLSQVSLAPVGGRGRGEGGIAAALTPTLSHEWEREILVNTAGRGSIPSARISRVAKAADVASSLSGLDALAGVLEDRPALGAAALDRLFDVYRKEGVAVEALSTGRTSSFSSSVLSADEAPSALVALAAPPAPRSSLRRSVKVGLLAASAAMTLETVSAVVAAVAGYHAHPNYRRPEWALLMPGDTFTLHFIVPPLAEEAIFRAGLMGGTYALLSRRGVSPRRAFWLSATLSSLVFTAVHETSDPLFFAVRLAGSYAFSWVYQHEGLPASIAMHFWHNLLVRLTPLLLLLPLGVLPLQAMTVAVLMAGFIATSAADLLADEPRLKAGEIAPHPMTPRLALAAAGVLFWVLSWFQPGPLHVLWGIPALGYLLFALREITSRPRS